MELSSKVVDCLDRLQRTLAHELCHVAAWLLDHVSKPPHGQVPHGPCYTDAVTGHADPSMCLAAISLPNIAACLVDSVYVSCTHAAQSKADMR